MVLWFLPNNYKRLFSSKITWMIASLGREIQTLMHYFFNYTLHVSGLCIVAFSAYAMYMHISLKEYTYTLIV
jgi:uncharacterized membrane protein